MGLNKIILLILISAVSLSAQTKGRKAILWHQSTGLNYWGVNVCLSGAPSIYIPQQVPVYNDKYSLTDTVYFNRRMFPIGSDPWSSSWNVIHHIFDGDGSYAATGAQLIADTAFYGVIHIKTCFAWEMGWQALTPVYTDEQIAANRETYHNMSTSKYHIRSIVARMAEMNTVKWILWTMPPGNQDQSPTSSANDDSLATWMKETLAEGLDSYGAFPSNVYVFDLFHHCADAGGEMPLIYSCASNNSHPNELAVETFSPTIVEETFNWVITGAQSNEGKYIVHPYPRKAAMTWNPTCAWDMARFDIVMSAQYDTVAIRRARALTDSTYFIPTRDYNHGGIYAEAYGGIDIPSAFWAYSAAGIPIQMSDPVGYLGNLSSYCDTASWNGNQFWKNLADSVVTIYDWSLWDGIHSDGTHHSILGSNAQIVDLDRNTLADYSEGDKGLDWIETQWHWGWNMFSARLRFLWDSLGYQNKVISMWTMGSYNYQYGTIIDTLGVKQWNGEEWESAWEENAISGSNTFVDFYSKYNVWRLNHTYEPSWHLITYHMSYGGLGRTNFKMARFWTGWGCMTDAYICLHDIYNSGVDHEASLYYDEFDISLGHPTGIAQQTGNGAWVRFFDNGAVIFHPGNTSSSITVTTALIDTMDGYNGPYYFVVTNQDTTRAAGVFSTVTLTPQQAGSYWAGDALFLMRWQDTVIADVIVDNAYFPTSPGCTQATLSGFTHDGESDQQSGGTGIVYTNPTFTNCMHWSSGDGAIFTTSQAGRQHYAINSASDTTATATFTPKLNRAGYWSLYEWHGWGRGDSSAYLEATDARIRINYSGGYKDTTINQRVNAGQWNYLGSYLYAPGGACSVVLNNHNSTGMVLADAFRWVFSETSEIPEEPEPPTTIKKFLYKAE